MALLPTMRSLSRRSCGLKRTRERPDPGEIGGADGIRTHDLLDAIEARSQLRHGPTDKKQADLFIASCRGKRQTTDLDVSKQIPSGSLFLPGAENGAHDDHADEAIAVVDEEKMEWAPFELIGGQGRGSDKADPKKNAER